MKRIKQKYIKIVSKYAMKTKLDIRGTYSKETWNNSGFKDSILEDIKPKEDERK